MAEMAVEETEEESDLDSESAGEPEAGAAENKGEIEEKKEKSEGPTYHLDDDDTFFAR